MKASDWKQVGDPSVPGGLFVLVPLPPNIADLVQAEASVLGADRGKALTAFILAGIGSFRAFGPPVAAPAFATSPEGEPE